MSRTLMTPEQFSAASAVRSAGDRLALTRARLAYDQADVRRAIRDALAAGVYYRDLVEPSGMSTRYVYLIWREMRESGELAA